jgi:asparagine synthase (glutamine-hydrolysing)
VCKRCNRGISPYTSVRRYWDWDFGDAEPNDPARMEEKISELQALLMDAIKLQLRADVPVGAYLSGGLDSSIVVSGARHFVPKMLRTYSLTFSDAEFDESRWQQELVQQFRTEHVARAVSAADIAESFARAIWHIESPVVRTAGVPLMLLAERVRASGIKVVLTGEGADEVFAGYDLFKEAKVRRFWARRPNNTWRPLLLRRLYGYVGNSPTSLGVLGGAFFRRGLTEIQDPFYAHRTRWETTQRGLSLLSGDARAQLEAESPISALASRAPTPAADWSGLGRDQYVEAHTLLSSYLLQAQGDRVAMAASIEGRYPFLDHRVIEFASRLPPSWKMRGLTEKYLLRRATAGWVPESITRRTKQPYRAPDVQSFFANGQLRECVADALSGASLRSAGYFDDQKVSWLVEKCRAGKAIGFADNMAFMLVLSTQLLHQQFISQR